jgi:hypothetical protein
MQKVVRETAKALVGAQQTTIFQEPDKKGVQKSLKTYTLPDISETRCKTNAEGVVMWSPDWRKSGGHKDNKGFIDALVKAVQKVQLIVSVSVKR